MRYTIILYPLTTPILITLMYCILKLLSNYTNWLYSILYDIYTSSNRVNTFLTHAFLLSKGRKRRHRNKKKSFAEENRGCEESTLSATDLRSLRQAERRLNRDEIYCLKKVQALGLVAQIYSLILFVFFLC